MILLNDLEEGKELVAVGLINVNPSLTIVPPWNPSILTTTGLVPQNHTKKLSNLLLFVLCQEKHSITLLININRFRTESSIITTPISKSITSYRDCTLFSHPIYASIFGVKNLNTISRSLPSDISN